mgnify:CR=1 FL=1
MSACLLNEIKKMTNEQQMKEGLNKLIGLAGNKYRLAKALSVIPQNVNNWYVRGRISATMAIEAEKIFDITKQELRPDVDRWRKG